MKKLQAFGISTIGIAALLGLAAVCRPKHTPPPPTTGNLSRPLPATTDGLRLYVRKHSSDPDSTEQDRVGAARIRLAYETGQKSQWTAARAEFLTATKEYKGTGTMSGDFGGVRDQALYQAAVCLAAAAEAAGADKLKQKTTAEAEFVRFMREQPLSPLVYAARRRLMRLNGSQAKPEWDELLQEDIAKQEKHARLESAMCGPRCIEHLLSLHLLPASQSTPHGSQALKTDYKSIATLCGTTDQGTSVKGLRDSLKAFGYQTFAYVLNHDDLMRAPMPAIVEEANHYLLIEKVSGNEATVYDPLTNSTTTAPLPKEATFQIPTILFAQPDLNP